MKMNTKKPVKKFKDPFLGNYCIVRTYSAGCFAGQVVFHEGKNVYLKNCRRLWAWTGAASLSQLATTGTSSPDTCKFPAPTELHYVSEAIELMICSHAAKYLIERVPRWIA